MPEDPPARGGLAPARRMLDFIDAAPSPFHACAEAAARLEAAGFVELREVDAWPGGAGACFVRRGGSLVAWSVDPRHGPADGFRIIGAHTDSPNLRVKPHADAGRVGYRQVAVEVYGGPLLNSWLDRDLGLSGRVTTTSGEVRLLHLDRALLRIPQLAIHLDREVNEKGLVHPDPRRRGRDHVRRGGGEGARRSGRRDHRLGRDGPPG